MCMQNKIMFLGSPLPTWKQITGKMKTENAPYYGTENVLYLAESCMSIALIISSLHRMSGKERIKCWIPDYFCNQTVRAFYDARLDIYFYPINEELDPEWSVLREKAKESKPDILIFVHYFGKYHPAINTAKEFCRLNAAVLIEDCAHVLYATGKIGKAGDFVLFSPHKQLPVEDGAVLILNLNEKNQNIKRLQEEVIKSYKLLPIHSGNVTWKIKKGIQKVVPVHRHLSYFQGVHYGNGAAGIKKCVKISGKSYDVLRSYTYMDLKKIAYIRRDNVSVMNYIVSRKFPELIPLIDESVDAPYYAVYSMKEAGNKKELGDSFIKQGLTAQYWPDLPIQIRSHGGHAIAERLSEDIVTFPVHQDIKPQKLIKKFLGASGGMR